MKIKKLSNKLIEEGITIEAVNSPLFDKRYSPVILNQGGEDVNILCINKSEKQLRFWILDKNGKAITEKGVSVVITEEVARIGRARFLMLHGKEEEAERMKKFYKQVDELVETWKREIDNKLRDIFFDVQVLKCLAGEEYVKVNQALIPVEGWIGIKKQFMEDFEIKALEENAKLNWRNKEEYYNELSKLQQDGDYYQLCVIFNIVPKNTGNPVFVAHFDNPVEIEQLKLLFGKEAIDRFAGDRLKIAAAIHLNKLNN